MRPTLDSDHKELGRVLDELLAEDKDISLHEVARRHPTIKHASSFLRGKRKELIQRAQARQDCARAEVAKPHIEKAASLSDQLEDAKARLAGLDAQLKALVASHAACVRAVMLHGGMPGLERFWRDYKLIGDAVRAAGGMPAGADVICIGRRPATQNRRSSEAGQKSLASDYDSGLCP